jgi:hypothetical protein
MIGIIRPCLVSGVAVLAASALVVTPVTPAPIRPEPPPLALAALARPLTASTTVTSFQPLDLVGQQVSFHVGFVADFVVTGAQLFARQVPIPGTLLQDIQDGTPLPVALGRALQTFADVEIDAGRELVGFATEYVNFQIGFLAKVLRDVMTTVNNTTIAFAAFAAFAVGVVGQLVTSMAAGLSPASTQAVPTADEPVSVGPAPASTRQTTPPAATELRSAERAIETAQGSTRTASTGGDTVTEQPKRVKPPASAVEASATVTEPTVTAQGEVRTATRGTTDADGGTGTDRDDATQANKGGDRQARSKTDAAHDHEGDTDNAPQKYNAPEKDSVTNDKP